MAVTVEFSSGFGNQLFQFAAGYNLAARHGTELIADTWLYNVPCRDNGATVFRPFMLERLGLPVRLRRAPPAALLGIRGIPRLRRLLLNVGARRYHCAGDYLREFERLPSRVLLSGYFQDIRYLGDRVDEIVRVIHERLYAVSSAQFTKLDQSSGALHVRRGDYLGHAETFPLWFDRYSREAARQMLTTYGCEKVMVFTDDPPAAREVFENFDGDIEIAHPSDDGGGLTDLRRMASARVLAIANSTFSWWAAMLAGLNGSTVVAPRRWLSSVSDPATRLYPKSWNVLDVD